MAQTPLLVERKCAALKEALVALGVEVEQTLRRSLVALRTQDLGLAREIIAGDQAIDHQRRILIQESLLILAAYQPAGTDLRLAGATLEMIPELERIGDYAVDIARILLRHEGHHFADGLLESLLDMGEAAVGMFRDAMCAYAAEGGDPVLARAVASRDDQVDSLQRDLLDAVVELIRVDPETARGGLSLSWCAHLYERVADRSTNLAERVIYIATGESPELG